MNDNLTLHHELATLIQRGCAGYPEDKKFVSFKRWIEYDLQSLVEMHHLYVVSTIKDGKHVAPVKIGVASDAAKRVASLKTGCPNEIGLTFVFPIPGRDLANHVERCAHAVGWSRGNHRKGEWFNIPPALAIDMVAKTIFVLAKENRGGGSDDLLLDLEIMGVIDAYALWLPQIGKGWQQ
jgi:hypothetical protein